MKGIQVQIQGLVEGAKTIGVVSHVNPDGDNLGSTTALVSSLQELGKKVYYIDNDLVPEDFLFLPHIDQRVKLSDLPKSLDLLFILDSSNPERLGPDHKDILGRAKKKINIDHHISNTNYGDINLVLNHATSTGEVLTDLLLQLQWPLKPGAATSLYTAISTDTGSFQYDSVTANTHRLIASLIELGADTGLVNRSVYQSKSLAKTMLLIRVVSKVHFACDKQLAIVTSSLEDLRQSKALDSDTEGIIEFVRNIQGVELAILLKEKQDSVKLSLRSKSYIDCTQIAGKFGGGGHIRASGATIKLSLPKAYQEVLEVAKEAFH